MQKVKADWPIEAFVFFSEAASNQIPDHGN